VIVVVTAQGGACFRTAKGGGGMPVKIRGGITVEDGRLNST